MPASKPRFRFRRFLQTLALSLSVSTLASLPNAAADDEVAITGHSASTVIVPVIDFPRRAVPLSAIGFFDFHGWSGAASINDPWLDIATDDTPISSLAAERITNLGNLVSNEIAPINKAGQTEQSETVAPTADTVKNSLTKSILGAVAIRVQQFVEPFAMVQPQQDALGIAEQLKQVQKFLAQLEQNAQNLAKNNQVELPLPIANTDKQPQFVTADQDFENTIDPSYFDQFVDSLDRRLATLALAEPLDIESQEVEQHESDWELQSTIDSGTADRLAIVEAEVDSEFSEPFGIDTDSPVTAAEDSIVVTKLDPLVGGSVFVGTLDSGYLSYDLAARDKALYTFPTDPVAIRNMLSTPSRPYRGTLGASSVGELTSFGSLGDLLMSNDLESMAVSKVVDPVAAEPKQTTTNVNSADWITRFAFVASDWNEKLQALIEQGHQWIAAVAKSAEEVESEEANEGSLQQIAQSVAPQQVDQSSSTQPSKPMSASERKAFVAKQSTDAINR